MKKRFVSGLIIAAMSVMAIAACGGNPHPAAPAKATQPPPPPASSLPAPVTGEIVLDGAANITVYEGDTLSKIAAARYGNSNMFYFPLIRLANANVVSDPDVIEKNTSLVIPDLPRNLNNAGGKAAIRADMLATASKYDREGKPKAAATLRNLAARLAK